MHTDGSRRPQTILLFDDDAVALDATLRLLVVASFRCLPTASGAAGRRVLAYVEPDLLVARLRAGEPENQALIQQAEARRIPVVAVTEHHEPPAERRLGFHVMQAGLLQTGDGQQNFLRVVDRLLKGRPLLRVCGGTTVGAWSERGSAPSSPERPCLSDAPYCPCSVAKSRVA